MKNLFKNEKGSAVIFELAVLMPIMIMVFYGYTMFTNALAIDLAVKTAAREGSREYAITGNANEGISKANEELIASRVSGATVTSFEEGKGRGIKVVKMYGLYIPFVGEIGPHLNGVGIFIEEPNG